jgi:hypothetical protein
VSVYNNTPTPNELYHYGVKGMKWGKHKHYKTFDGDWKQNDGSHIVVISGDKKTTHMSAEKYEKYVQGRKKQVKRWQDKTRKKNNNHTGNQRVTGAKMYVVNSKINAARKKKLSEIRSSGNTGGQNMKYVNFNLWMNGAKPNKVNRKIKKNNKNR